MDDNKANQIKEGELKRAERVTIQQRTVVYMGCIGN
jgi:hypothetical protein